MTGKRHGFHAQWRVGFDDDGRLHALDATLTSDGGWSLDLSEPVLARALCHIDNAYWIPARPRERPGRADQQDLADRVPRVRRTAGHARDRGHPRPVRAAARDRPGRPAPPQLLRRGPGHAVRPAGAAPRAGRARLGPGGRRPATSRRGWPRSRRTTRAHPHTEAGARRDAGEVRDLVQLHGLQPGRRARARLQGRLGADQPRRHRDGPGPAHEDAPGRGDVARRTAGEGAARADAHRQGAQHLRHGRELGRRPQRRRGQARVRADHGAARGRARRPRHRLGRPGPRGLLQPRPAVGGGLLPHRGAALGLHRDARPPVQVLRVRRRRRRGRGRRLHRRLPHPPGRHRARRRRLACRRWSTSARSRAASCRERGG